MDKSIEIRYNITNKIWPFVQNASLRAGWSDLVSIMLYYFWRDFHLVSG
jgi:hypothetical protein